MLERVDVLDLLKAEDVGLDFADGGAGDRLVVDPELLEKRLIDDPAVLVGLGGIDVVLEAKAGEEVLDVERRNAHGGHGRLLLDRSAGSR
jgi:hypothetical protein